MSTTEAECLPSARASGRRLVSPRPVPSRRYDEDEGLRAAARGSQEEPLASATRLRIQYAVYHAAHREERNAYSAAYRATHREEKRAYAATYNATHREETRSRRAAYNLAHRAEQKAYRRDEMHDYLIAYSAARRARKKGSGGSHTQAEWLDKCGLLGNVCIYCGEAKRLTRDHKIPLVRGGSDDISNIVPACGSCNCRKHAFTAAEFIARRRAS